MLIEILQWISIYLMIGVIFTFSVDMMTQFLHKQSKVNYEAPSMDEWGVVERLLCIILWPLGMYVFKRGIMKSYDDE